MECRKGVQYSGINVVSIYVQQQEIANNFSYRNLALFTAPFKSLTIRHKFTLLTATRGLPVQSLD